MPIIFEKLSIENIKIVQEIAKKSWYLAYRNIISRAQINFMLEKMYHKNIIMEQLSNKKLHYLLLKQDNEFIGYTSFEIDIEPYTTKLHKLYLLPEKKKTGAGKQAIEFLKNFATNSSNEWIILNVNKQNPSVGFYKHMGFVVRKEEILEIENGYVMDDFVMEYKI